MRAPCFRCSRPGLSGPGRRGRTNPERSAPSTSRSRRTRITRDPHGRQEGAALIPDTPIPLWVIVSAGLSSVLLTGGWLVADAVQPNSYSPVRQTVSVLAGYSGTDRWLMTAALFLVGGCYLATAAGLTGIRLPARILLALSGLASIGIAASPEPAHGSTPQHLAWTAFGEITIAAWPAFCGRRASPRPLLLSVTGAAAATALSLALLGWLVIETHSGSTLGLAERLSSSIQTSWPFVVAFVLRAQTPKTSAAATSPGRDQARPVR
jgi:hypothetical protein